MKITSKTKTSTPKHKGVARKVTKGSPMMKGKMKMMKRGMKGSMC